MSSKTEEKTGFCGKLWKDFTTVEYIPLKLLYFFLFGGMMTLFPFLTIQARALGIQEEELGIIYTIVPIVALTTPSLSGFIADKIGNYKILLSVSVALSGISATFFLLVPVGRILHKLPEEVMVNVNCSAETPFAVVNPPHRCDFKVDSVNLTALDCYISCGKSKINFQQQNIGGCGKSKSCLLLGGIVEVLQISADVDNSTSPSMITIPSGFCTSEDAINGPNYLTKGYDERCSLSCIGTIPRDSCSNIDTWEDINPTTTLIIYSFVRIWCIITLATTIPLFEGAAVTIMRKTGGDFGFQRIYTNVGAIVFTPISGALIDYMSKSGVQDFSPAFYLFCATKLVSAAIILKVDLDFKKPSTTLVKDLKGVLKNVEVLAFLFICCLLGACFGFLDTFFFWLLQDMGASKQLMGITVMVGSLTGIPIILASTPIIKRLGHVNTLILGFTFYTIRIIGYSYITNPWMSMPFEALECFTNSLVGTAAVSYVGALSTPSTVASLQGLEGGIYHGVGRATGSFIGGFMTKSLGIRYSFRIMAVVSGVICLGYFTFNMTYLRKHGADVKKKKELQNKDNPEKGQISTVEKDEACSKKDEKDHTITSKGDSVEMN